MTNDILFSERQKFRQWWLWLIILGINAVFLLGTYKQIALGEQFGDKPMSNGALLLTVGLLLLITIFFLALRLDTTIKRDGIYVQFFPFHFTPRHYDWGTFTKSYVRRYSPLMEYGGWGLRFGLFGSGTAFNVSGNKGLQLEFTNGKKLLIGTNKPEELIQALTKLGQLKS